MSSGIIDIIQGQIPRPPGIELATVIQADPLVIRLDNDNIMLRAEDGDLLVCEHLLQHTRTCSINAQVTGTMTTWGDTSPPEHSHTHTLQTVTASKQTVTIHAKLKAGDRVVVMALPGGQQYLIWDKVVVL